MLSSLEKIALTLWATSALLVIIFYFSETPPIFKILYSEITQFVTAISCSLACFRTALSRTSNSHDKKGWLFIAIAMTLWATGQAIYGYCYVVTREIPPNPYYSDFAFIGMVVFFIMGLIVFHKGAVKDLPAIPKGGKIIALIFLYVTLITGFISQNYSFSGLSFFVALCYNILDPIILYISILLFFSLIGEKNGMTWIFIVIGILLYIVANQVYYYLDYRQAYASGSPNDTLWILSFCFIATAAIIAHKKHIEPSYP